MQMQLNSTLSALAAIPSALGCSGWRNPLRFIRFIRASIVSLFYMLANPHHAEDAYMALDRVVARATRWRESAGHPFDRSVLMACKAICSNRSLENYSLLIIQPIQ